MTAIRFTVAIASSSCRVVRVKEPPNSSPALLTSTSSGPIACSASRTRRSRSVASVRSTGTACASAPNARSSSATASISLAGRSDTARSDPSPASPREM
jgi:hypothetical protein